ncbi:MAG: class I SAM-dependent methyltransferase [Mariprofundus sp.]
MSRHKPVSRMRWQAAQKQALEKWKGKGLQHEREQMERNLLPLLQRYARDYPKTATILEIGCGPICISQYLPQQSKTYLDPLLDDFRRIYPGKLPEGKYLASGAERIDCPDASYDLIICNHAISCSMNPELIMHEMERLLKPEGRLILTMTTHSALEARMHYYAECCAPSLCHKTRPYYYSATGIRRTLSRHFTIAHEMTGRASFSWLPLCGRVERTFICTHHQQSVTDTDNNISGITA